MSGPHRNSCRISTNAHAGICFDKSKTTRIPIVDITHYTPINYKKIVDDYKLSMGWRRIFRGLKTNDEVVWYATKNTYWIFYPVDTLIRQQNYNVQKRWIDIAIYELGSALHALKLCWDSILKKWFIRKSGGGNHIEIDENERYFITNAEQVGGFNIANTPQNKLLDFNQIEIMEIEDYISVMIDVPP